MRVKDELEAFNRKQTAAIAVTPTAAAVVTYLGLDHLNSNHETGLQQIESLNNQYSTATRLKEQSQRAGHSLLSRLHAHDATKFKAEIKSKKQDLPTHLSLPAEAGISAGLGGLTLVGVFSAVALKRRAARRQLG